MADTVPNSFLIALKRGQEDSSLDSVIELLNSTPGVTIKTIMKGIKIISIACEPAVAQFLKEKLSDTCHVEPNYIRRTC